MKNLINRVYWDTKKLLTVEPYEVGNSQVRF
uniref:Ribosomal protein L32 n=3 Tax=Epimedium TaxID=63350 RepID=A0A7M3UMI0_9MAGN|nr:ribosomal protein L32 [Epimedium dewuense]YP_010014651.1 ribosomal protein L32 [Epimedium simplicifolium]YP_010342498.1 ribosomal protein L32 [Epimedium leptorrhizum]YP_010342583.1 ribosomal protein L32 [Epimedium platypetalum]QOI13535.1 ribosomal protein L32 [Epimedium pubescens]UOA65421.1 ribosomal protein L32 [Epimedium davidii]QOI13195.1 ribosomal protein L32 [Epimedium dewuense]QOI13448.1 ribosomal protein L32 [Epimedium simplicifolium]UOA65507.1 ribosomal protein L32 [Epimedium lep